MKSFVLTMGVLATTLCAAVAGWTADAPKAQAVKPVATITGSVANEAKQTTAAVITDSVALGALWKDWAIGDKMPEVNFAKQLVVQTTTRGSILTLTLTLDSAGNLAVGGNSTKDLRPGFRYVIAVVNCDGIKSVNGTPLPATRRLAPIAEYKGSVDDANLQIVAPEYITDAETFGTVWTRWKVGEKQPEVDFTTQFVAVSTSVGSILTADYELDNTGNLQNFGMVTMDFRDGFRYIISVLSRDGVKTVGGQALPAGK